MGVSGQRDAPVALPLLYRRPGGPPGLVLTGAENLAPTGIRSPDRSSRSESLYRLSYPGPAQYVLDEFKTNKIWAYDLNLGSES